MAKESSPFRRMCVMQHNDGRKVDQERDEKGNSVCLGTGLYHILC
jgi:hypothetical protein